VAAVQRHSVTPIDMNCLAVCWCNAQSAEPTAGLRGEPRGQLPRASTYKGRYNHWNKSEIQLKCHVTFSACNKAFILNIKEEVYNFY
jgi:hypothetical protein